MSEKHTSEYILAYFDILGYKDLLKRRLVPEVELIRCIEHIVQMVLFMQKPLFGGQGAKVYCFSDNLLYVLK
jgi:hypothetical protein